MSPKPGISKLSPLLFLLVGAAERPLVIEGGTLVDVSAFGASNADISDAVVVVRGGEIVAAGARGDVPIPEQAAVIDARGKYLVPGLHDVFATVNNQGQANAYLAMGVTSIVGLDEPGGRRGPLFLGADPSPRVYPLDVIEGYDVSAIAPEERSIYTMMTQGRPLGERELIEQIDAFAGRGVKVLLLYYTLAPEQVRVVARHARAGGLATIGELGATTYAQGIEAGVMALVHTSRYSLDLTPQPLRDEVARAPFGPPRRRFYEFLMTVAADTPALLEYAAQLARGRVALIPTLAMNYLELPGHGNPWNEPVAALLDPADIHLPADRETGEQVKPALLVRDGFPEGASAHLGVLEAAYCRAGAKYLAGSGTDAFGTMAGISLHIELEQLVRACLTPRQALAAATGNVGAIFGWPKVGQIRAGANADLLVLDADPTTDIAHLKRIRHVVLGGELLDPKTLLGAR